jgi:NhaA family Na+:H+ antiporter
VVTLPGERGVGILSAPMAGQSDAPKMKLPKAPIDRLAKPFADFLRIESASGLLLAGCAVFALVVANSPWAEGWLGFWETHLTVSFAGVLLDYPLWYWVNDGLMTIFFFVIGLEMKRELTTGELRDPRSRTLPVAAAIGGAVVPAGIYAVFHAGTEAADGWAVPMATDIAFVVGFLALFGRRVPLVAKVFLLSLAIVDDLMAVAVIAAFFTEDLKIALLLGAGAGFVVVYLMRWAGVRAIGVYVMVGTVIWFCMLKGGVHPTVAGVMLGLMTPSSPLVGKGRLRRILSSARRALPGVQGGAKTVLIEQTQTAMRESVSPLERLEHALHPWVAFGIMPVFALANAGLPLSWGEVVHPVSLAVAAGLFIGKPVGICLFVLIAIKAGIAKLPAGLTPGVLFAGASLCGVGFTMALFLASLGLEPPVLDNAKMGVMVGSALSAVVSMAILARVLPKAQPEG